MTNQSSTNSAQSVSFLNLFGIFVSIVLCVLFIILGGHTLKYIKHFAVKIKIIVNRAEDKNVQLKDFNYKGNENKNRSEAYEQMEVIYKNEIKKSRSLQYWNIMKNLIAKYDHLLYYPFRDKVTEKYDLLKPKTTFYVLLVICSCCIAWMTTIFLSAILQTAYSNVTLIPIGVFVGLTVAISFISSILNLIATNRLFRIYLLNVKAAFKVDYGHKFLALDKGLGEYEPENSEEEQEIFKHQEMLKNLEIVEDLDQDDQRKENDNFTQQDFSTTQRGLLRDEIQLNSNRKLLGEEMERSDGIRRSQSNQAVIEERKDEDIQEERNNGPAEDPNAVQNVQKRRVKGKAIKDVFDLQVGIDGADDANTEDKYIFVEDKHAIGDMDLLENEAMKGENKSNMTTFVTLFVIIAVASAVCCYLNYSFADTLTKAVFIMFVCSFFGDIIVSRPIILLLISLIQYSRAKRRGYERIQYKSPKEVRDLFNKAIRDMFVHRQKQREEEQHKKVNPFSSSRGFNTLKNGNDSGDQFMNDNITQNAIERNDTTIIHKMNNFEDAKEDELAQIINEKRDDDFDGASRIKMLDLKVGSHPTDYARPQIEDETKKPFEQTQVLSYNTHVPLLSNLTKALQEKEEERFQGLMEKKQLTNDLVDYNLLLLRKIYDAYEDRAEKVLKNFRSDRNGVLRKRYMVPILNPNYDYEKLLQEMLLAGKVAMKNEEEESVHLDGVTVCDDFERQLMEAIIQEASDDLLPAQVDRQKIDKFGNLIDENKLRDGIAKACPAPNFGYIEFEVEENIEEDDEVGRKRRMLELLRQKLANGEELSAEELALLKQLEDERIQELDKLIQSYLQRGYENLSDEEKLAVIGLQKEKANILMGQIQRKKDKTQEDLKKINEYQDELKDLELEELRLKLKLYGLSDKDLARLIQLEDEKLAALNKRIIELKSKGWDNLTDHEKLELLQLQQQALTIELDKLNRKKPPLSEKDQQRIQDIGDELRNLEYQELLLKKKMGLLTDAEQLRLNELQAFFDEQQRLKDLAEQERLRQLEFEAEQERLRQLQEQAELDRLKELEELEQLRLRELDELEMLRQKFLNGTITEEELRRLRELEAKHGFDPIVNPFQEQIELNQEFEENVDLQPDQEEIDESDLMKSRISDQENFSELPPVMVMNNVYNKPESPEKLSEDENENQISQVDNVFLNANQLNEDEFAFGHDDLESNKDAAPGANDEDSIYQHDSSAILDEENVQFMHIEHLPNQDNGSEDSFDEQDMVYYNKDDLTNYSKGLKLNKVKARVPQYYSENDLHEVQEGQLSEAESFSGRSGRSGRSGKRSLDQTLTRKRAPVPRGTLSHNQLEAGSHEDLIEGRVKVDAWNLNYRGKKNKLKKKKRKTTNNQFKRMNDLQNIYGVDARTLAGLEKGRLPRKQLATGKLKGDGFDGPQSRMMESTDGFRSTQNTFYNKNATPGHHLKESINDNQSNLFSMNGFGTRTGFNQTGMRGGVRDSRNFGMSQQKSSAKKNGLNSFGKLTQTQQNFKDPRNSGYNNINSNLEEESKSGHTGSRNGSRGGSLNRQYKASLAQNLKNQGKAKKGTKDGARKNKKNKAKQNYDAMDSHEESDEAVDDNGAMFQKRNGPYNQNRKGLGGMNDTNLDHSESEEGNYQENPSFSGNDFMFKKRGANAGSSKVGQNSKNRNGQSNNRSQKRGAGNGLNIEDLEAQNMSGRRGKKNTKNNGFMRGDSADRQDSEEENFGGQINFQERNPRGDYDADDLEMGRSGVNARNKSNNKLNMSTSKPPLSGRKGLSNIKNGKGKARDGSSSQKNQNIRGNMSDYERQMRNSKFSQGYNQSDLDIAHSRMGGKMRGEDGRASESDLLRMGRGKYANQANSRRKRNRSFNGAQNSDDDGDDYIVGPESNHSSIRKRPFGRQTRASDDDDYERYLLLQRERQIMEDIESNDGEGKTRLAKKRKIRKAAQSQNTRDLHSKRLQDMQNERLRKKQREAEAALFANEDDLEAGKAKLRKKKVKKDWVKKEINYWLDYDSPYAEYLVARFREYSPNPGALRGPSAASSRKGGQLQNKYNEVANIYQKHETGRQGSQQSRSRSKGKGEATLNNSQQRNSNLSTMKLNQSLKKNSNQQLSSNNLFVNDYDEE